MEIDAEKLLFLIETRPQIYNYYDKDHSNKIIIEKLWMEIAKELKCEVSKCRTKWTNLRNSYTRYLRETKNRADSGKKKKKWYLVDAMSFLEGYVNQHHYSRSSLYNQTSIGDGDEFPHSNSPNFQNENTQPCTSSDGDSPMQSKKPKTSSTGTVPGPTIEFVQSRPQENTSESGSSLFFRSMLADYEKLSSRGQRAFKLHMLNKMNELLQEEEDSLLIASPNETTFKVE